VFLVGRLPFANEHTSLKLKVVSKRNLNPNVDLRASRPISLPQKNIQQKIYFDPAAE
jgi:hypothetical protein